MSHRGPGAQTRRTQHGVAASEQTNTIFSRSSALISAHEIEGALVQVFHFSTFPISQFSDLCLQATVLSSNSHQRLAATKSRHQVVRIAGF